MNSEKNENKTNLQNNNLKMDFTKSERFNKLEKYLTCPQCNNIFCDPVTLFCQHTICKSCLLYSSNNCLICGTQHFIPISPNYQLNSIIEKIYGESYVNNRREQIETKINNDMKLKRNYKIRKEYFNELINNIYECNGKFIFNKHLNF